MSDTTANIIGAAIIVLPMIFVFGHMVGYRRGKGRVTCPLCDGCGSVRATGPTINSEKEVFEAGFNAGLREGRSGRLEENLVTAGTLDSG